MTANPTAWAAATPPVIHGPRPPGVTTLYDLATPHAVDDLLNQLRDSCGTSRKQPHLTLIHFGVYTAVTVLVTPLIVDDDEVTARADQVGFTLDDELGFTSFWIGTFTRRRGLTSSRRLGSTVIGLVAPIVDHARACARVSDRVANTIALDALRADCRSLNNRAGADRSRQWMAELITGTGLVSHRPQRHVIVSADSGPPVEVTAPRVCCVLSSRPSEHACPTCPLYPHTDVQRRTEQWLRGLDDESFNDVTGRIRQHCAPARTT